MAGIIFNIQESLNNSAFNVLQEPIKMILENEVEAFEKNSIISKVFVMKTTDKYREEFRSTTAMDGFKPTEDMEVAGLSDFQEGYSKQFVFQTWTNSFVVSKQTIEDNQTMTIEPKAMGFIKSYGRTREEYAVNVLGAALGGVLSDKQKELGIKAAHGKGMDTVDGEIDGVKQTYFHNAHKGVKIDGKSRVTQSNKFYANLDLTDGTVGNLEEKVLDVIEQAASKMRKYKDDKGNIVPVTPNTIVMAEDYRLSDIVMRALKSKYGSAMGGNGVNLVFGKYELVISPYLSEIEGFKGETEGEGHKAHGLILLDTNRNREGLGAVWFDRKPLEVRSYKDDKTEANVWAGRARFGAGFGDFRAMSYVGFHTGAIENATQLTPVSTGVSLTKNVQ